VTCSLGRRAGVDFGCGFSSSLGWFPRHAWSSEWVSHAPIRRPAWWRAAMTVTPGTGLLSQDSERGQGWLMRSRELTRGWRPSRLVRRTAAGGVGEQVVGAGE
jgi:hypothetical protein